MNKALTQGLIGLGVLWLMATTALSQTGPPSSNPSTASQSSQPAPPLRIAQLYGSSQALNGLRTDGAKASGSIGLNQELRVVVAPALPATDLPQLDGKRYALFFNGRELKGLPDPFYDDKQHSLVFELKRVKDNQDNNDLWASLLGSPTSLTVPVTVSLGERPADPASATPPTIFAAAAGADKLSLDALPPWRLGCAIVLIGAAVALLWGRARHNPTLRDNMLPQLPPSLQTYSLARWQMAFWFTLIFTSFILLFVLLWDPNTISAQALMLMSISGATALASVTVDYIKDSPADAVNRGLQALGLNNYDDIIRIQKEIADRQTELAAVSLPSDARVLQLQAEIQDRSNTLQIYRDKTRPFQTQGWFNDLTTDLNGAAIHRLQVFCWTWVLGGVFVIGVWRDLSMPQFSATLLALMGISSAGYVGLKIPESNN